MPLLAPPRPPAQRPAPPQYTATEKLRGARRLAIVVLVGFVVLVCVLIWIANDGTAARFDRWSQQGPTTTQAHPLRDFMEQHPAPDWVKELTGGN